MHVHWDLAVWKVVSPSQDVLRFFSAQKAGKISEDSLLLMVKILHDPIPAHPKVPLLRALWSLLVPVSS